MTTAQLRWFLVGIVALFCGAALLCVAAGLRLDQIQPANVRLAWDPSPDTNVVGYALYFGTNSGDYRLRLNAGSNLTARVFDLQPGRWYVVATAYTDEHLESLPSNEINFRVPESPTNAVIVILQHSGDLTNFYDVGFFKLRMP